MVKKMKTIANEPDTNSAEEDRYCLANRLPLGVRYRDDPRVTAMAIADFEEINFENSVWFNRVELGRLLGGEDAMSIFSTCRRRALRKTGVCIKEHGGQGIVMSDRALARWKEGESMGWPRRHLNSTESYSP